MHVLNILVSPDLLGLWAGWLALERQPFFLTGEEVRALGLHAEPRAEARLTPEARDTFALWGVAPGADHVAWLTEEEWLALPTATQRALVRAQVRHGRGAVPHVRDFADLLPHLPGSRFVWWPSLLSPAVLARVVAQDQRACRRDEVPEHVWDAAATILPGARELAGTFPHASGPNCFGTVMGAAGVPGAEREWMQRTPFEAFLAERTQPGGRDDQPGTVLVWRDAAGAVQHAAVTLGGGWALHKPSQTWRSARVVLPVRELIAYSRTPGWRLGRVTLRQLLAVAGEPPQGHGVVQKEGRAQQRENQVAPLPEANPQDAPAAHQGDHQPDAPRGSVHGVLRVFMALSLTQPCGAERPGGGGGQHSPHRRLRI
ncbi:hypothetical protein L1280_002100 [Deinococcus sp. HSC-46F16]|uniref:hypothetical protein n=1 Tax=Deinococcus sp. HSC-46F16 TaxID=2910968 RepID=UPI00209F2EA3|nr:hypothetical protein [Deinococcus sp. HSC-46F16]MCP2014948.1 hypothetical protein [Deinococcus sp. HSC-46F16]